MPRLDWFGGYAAVPRVRMYGEEVVHLDDLDLSCEGEEQGRCKRCACRGMQSVDADILGYIRPNSSCDEQAGSEGQFVNTWLRGWLWACMLSTLRMVMVHAEASVVGT